MSKNILEVAVNVLVGYIESSHDSGFMFDLRDYVIFVIVEFQKNNLINYVCITIAEVVEYIEKARIIFQLFVFDFGG